MLSGRDFIISMLILLMINFLFYKIFCFCNKYIIIDKKIPKVNIIGRAVLLGLFFGLTCLVIIFTKFAYYFAENEPDVSYLIPYFALYYFMLGILFRPILNPLQQNTTLTVMLFALNIYSTLGEFIGNHIYFYIKGNPIYVGALLPAFVFSLALMTGILVRAFFPQIIQKLKKMETKKPE